MHAYSFFFPHSYRFTISISFPLVTLMERIVGPAGNTNCPVIVKRNPAAICRSAENESDSVGPSRVTQ